MNLRALTTPAMLALTDGWLSDPEIHDEVTSHELGAAVFRHLRATCNELSEQSYRYERVVAEIARLSQTLKTLSTDFSRKARAFHNHLDALADATDDPQRASLYRELKALYFPRGLSITKRSYLEMGGASMSLEQCAAPERMSELESIRVGEYTLAELFGDWIAVGKSINKHTQQRARLKASIAQRGSLATQAGKARLRNKWMRALRLVLGAIDDLPLPARVRERFLAPLLNVLSGQRRAEPTELPADTGVNAEAGTEPEVTVTAGREDGAANSAGGPGKDAATSAMQVAPSTVKRPGRPQPGRAQPGRAQPGNGQPQPGRAQAGNRRTSPGRAQPGRAQPGNGRTQPGRDHDHGIPVLRPIIESVVEDASDPLP